MTDHFSMPPDSPSQADAPFHCPPDDKRIGNKYAEKWPADRSEELERLHGSGLSFSEIALAINLKFKTTYTRNATIGRAGRMGLVSEKRRHPVVCKAQRKHQPYKPRVRKPKPAAIPTEAIKIRCEALAPRNLPLVELDSNDCRYATNDGYPVFLFCGHPKFESSSYCETHYHVCRDTFSPAIRGATGCRPSKLTRPEVSPGASHGIEDEGREASHSFKRSAA